MELATRCGVLSRPSRSGSSPSNSSSRRISFSNSLFTCVFDIVVFSLPQDQPGELAGPDLGIEYAPEREDDVLGCWNNSLHEGHVEIEVLVVHDIDDLAFDDFLELGKVADIPRFGVDLTLDRDIERVVVTVPVRIVAFSEQPRVLRVGELRIMDAVGGIEPHPAGDCYARHV